jgi:transcriptional regulator with XRE-family HTH domain
VWQQEAVRIALAGHNIAELFALLQGWGLSLGWIAARVGLNAVEVGQVLVGGRVDSYRLLARIAEGLGIPRGLMGLSYQPDPSRGPCDGCPLRRVVHRWTPDTVRALRSTLRLTQREFAARLGVAPRTVYVWENGAVPRPGSQQMLDACVHLLPADLRQRFTAAAVAAERDSSGRDGRRPGAGDGCGVDSTRSVAHATLTADT